MGDPAAGVPRAPTLVLIGDPKQAIYAFRGGDVVTYLARDAGSQRARNARPQLAQRRVAADGLRRAVPRSRAGRRRDPRATRSTPPIRTDGCRARRSRRRCGCGWPRASTPRPRRRRHRLSAPVASSSPPTSPATWSGCCPLTPRLSLDGERARGRTRRHRRARAHQQAGRSAYGTRWHRPVCRPCSPAPPASSPPTSPPTGWCCCRRSSNREVPGLPDRGAHLLRRAGRRGRLADGRRRTRSTSSVPQLRGWADVLARRGVAALLER